MFLLKVTEVTTEHQKWPKIRKKQYEKSFLCAKGKQLFLEGVLGFLNIGNPSFGYHKAKVFAMQCSSQMVYYPPKSPFS